MQVPSLRTVLGILVRVVREARKPVDWLRRTFPHQRDQVDPHTLVETRVTGRQENTITAGKHPAHTVSIRHLGPSACWIDVHAKLDGNTVLRYVPDDVSWREGPEQFDALMASYETRFSRNLGVASTTDIDECLPTQEDVTTRVYRRPRRRSVRERLVVLVLRVHVARR